MNAKILTPLLTAIINGNGLIFTMNAKILTLQLTAIIIGNGLIFYNKCKNTNPTTDSHNNWQWLFYHECTNTNSTTDSHIIISNGLIFTINAKKTNLLLTAIIIGNERIFTMNAKN